MPRFGFEEPKLADLEYYNAFTFWYYIEGAELHILLPSDDFIQTKTRRANPRESQRDLHDSEGLES
jgi:hypothetical protein